MIKQRHEIRDAVHSFIVFDNTEREVINSRPLQRLKSIRQLAMTYQIYPGAVHNRFEHSLGVMEFASRIFDSVLREDVISDEVRKRTTEQLDIDQKKYWRRVVRFAALLHDIGHLPFSHAAERDLLPEGWDHERITAQMVRESEICELLKSMTPPIRIEDVVDVLWQPSKRSKVSKETLPDPWKSLLNEIITGDTFGADRMDYLLRDSWHAGVPYGRFGPDRLISGLRLVISPENDGLELGIDSGAIHSAEALLLARYFMYTSVYYHDVRRAYDLHLKEFLIEAVEGGKFPNDWNQLLNWTDDEVMTMLRKSATSDSAKGHESAKRILTHNHMKTVYECISTHKVKNPNIVNDVYDFVCREFPNHDIKYDENPGKREVNEFWVLTDGEEKVPSTKVSGVIANIPAAEFGFVFADAEVHEQARNLIKDKFNSNSS